MSTEAGSDNPGWQRERQWLGFAALLPFLAGLGVLMSAEDSAWTMLAATGLSHYSAVIASFLGAVHWGIAADPRDRLRRARLRWGVTPALLAWTLLALPVGYALAGFAALFAFILLVDYRLLPALDDAYRRLRLQLSVVVTATLAAAALLAPGESL